MRVRQGLALSILNFRHDRRQWPPWLSSRAIAQYSTGGSCFHARYNNNNNNASINALLSVSRACIYATLLSSVQDDYFPHRHTRCPPHNPRTERSFYHGVDEKHLGDNLDLHRRPSHRPIKAEKCFNAATKYRGRRNHIPLPHATESLALHSKLRSHLHLE